MRYGAVIVAAGMSSRMKTFKPMMKVGENTFIENIIEKLTACGASEVCVVTGYRAEELERELTGWSQSRNGASVPEHRLHFVRNENYETTAMFDSVRLGLEFMKDRCDRLFLCPGDVPCFDIKTVRMEMERPEGIIIPVTDGRRGHPILIAASFIPRIQRHDGTDGLRGALDGFLSEIYLMEADDPGCLMDADTPEDLIRLTEYVNGHPDACEF